MCDEKQLNAFVQSGSVYQYNKVEDDCYMVDMERDLVEIGGKSIAIASAITSYARMELYSLMHDIRMANGTIYYTDTDSIITNYNVRTNPDMMKRYMWDGCGKALGAIKNECDDSCMDKKKGNMTREEL